jgi:predicted dehydrogenase
MSSMASRLSRRDVLKKSAALAAWGAAIPMLSRDRLALAGASPNDRPAIACIGLGGMGVADAREHAELGDIVAVCDVDRRRVETAGRDPTIGRGKAGVYSDYRKILDRKDIDVVSISTVDHWHVKIAIEALQAGKHVFCQKPLTLTLEENQLIRNACKKYKDRVLTVGTQRRTHRDLFLRATNMVQKGLLGDIRTITVGLNGCPTGGPFPKLAPPKELDWNMWLGQTPQVDYIEQRCHYNFRWWYEYSGGKFTDWGAHFIDIATWAIQQDQEGLGPIEIDGTDAKHPVPFRDGYPTVNDCYNTSPSFAVKCKFPGRIEMIATSHCDAGILFDGTKGRIFVNMGKITGKPIEENWDRGKYESADVVRLFKNKPFESHKQNFYRCIREGGLPISDVFSHVQTMNTCHLCAIAARLGRVIHWDPTAEKITDDDKAAGFFARARRQGFEIPSV